MTSLRATVQRWHDTAYTPSSDDIAAALQADAEHAYRVIVPDDRTLAEAVADGFESEDVL